MDFALATKLFAALFAIMNPLTNLPIFLSVTEGKGAKQHAAIALTGAVATFMILLVVLFAGNGILRFFGITVDDFRIAGGILILAIAFSMLHVQTSQINHTHEESVEGREKDNPGIFPLAIPLLAGPGSMTTVIVFAHRAEGFANKLLCAGVLFAVCVLIYITFAMGERISAWLGATGMNIVTRIMGMVLAAIAVGMIVNGVANAVPALQK
ncbi:MAG: MarC family protein [Hyphomicrobiaceae bacterium]|nr:MarC family protein [Hyphomicrobiaceae bacterium]